jgi:hypothetical protein
MLTEKDYCDKDLSNTLKELGYPTKMTFVSEFGSIEIPINSGLIQLYEAQKWLREEKDINVYVKAFNGEGWYYIIQNYKGARIYPPLTRILVLCHSYEEALLEGIKEAVKILKDE